MSAARACPSAPPETSRRVGRVHSCSSGLEPRNHELCWCTDVGGRDTRSSMRQRRWKNVASFIFLAVGLGVFTQISAASAQSCLSGGLGPWKYYADPDGQTKLDCRDWGDGFTRSYARMTSQGNFLSLAVEGLSPNGQPPCGKKSRVYFEYEYIKISTGALGRVTGLTPTGDGCHTAFDGRTAPTGYRSYRARCSFRFDC